LIRIELLYYGEVNRTLTAKECVGFVGFRL